ncbi:unnamed protein product [Mytilus edulis]|uniref:Sulfotransferase domain-containing protein n=1 Tax=Mytilus edulis TaxID=6550 RepID=A0A8S3PV32_MYTED|nr:unnamed protein product [Mytilus edulis]
MLLHQTTEYNTFGMLNKFNFECQADWERLEEEDDPRLFHTHLPPNDLYGGWFNFTREFEKAIEDNTANVLSITYEDLKLAAIQTVTKIANFLDVQVSDALVKDIVDKCAFGNLKENKLDVSAAIQTVTKIANFLDVQVSDALVKDIVDKCAFGNLKENKLDVSVLIHPEGESTLWRKGKFIF